MRKEFEFNRMKGEKNPYIKDLKTQITIRLDKETVEPDEYVFKRMR